MAKLGDVCTINPRSPSVEDDLSVSFVPMPKVGENGEFDATEIRPYREVKKGYTGFQNGDVLFAKITPCMENGKGAIAHDLENGIGFGSTEFHVLRPDTDKISSEWLYYLLRWPFFRKKAEMNMTGSGGQRRVPKEFLERYQLNIPDLYTQEKQSDTLDKISSLISLRKQQLEKLDELVKARFVEMFGDPVENPHHFDKVLLSELAEIRIGPFGSLLHKEDYIENGHPLVNPSHIINGEIVTDKKLTVSDEKYQELNAYHLKTGDVVLGRRGEMGRCAVVNTSGLLCGTGSLLIRTKGEVTADYLQKIISFPSFKATIEDMAVGQTMPNLNVPIVSRFQIIRPPMDVQRKYYDSVAKIDHTRLTVQRSLGKLETLKNALMQEYFG